MILVIEGARIQFYFQGDPSRLGHPQGLREQHPDGVQQESTSS